MPLLPYHSALLEAPRPRPAADAPPLPDGPRGSRYTHSAATVNEARHLVETTLMTYAEIARRTGIPARTVHHWASTRKWTRPAPVVLPGPPRCGPHRAHIAATVAEVRHLVETTLMTYAEIAQRTGVLRATIWKWSKTRAWMRPAFAPRWTHTVPVWRAGRARKRRMLGVRLVALAERYVRALEAASAVDVARLREARALLAMAKRAARPPTARQRLLAAVRPVTEAKPRARMIADQSGKGLDIAHAPRNKPTADAPLISTHRPAGSRLPHPDGKVKEVQALIETTTLTHKEISQRTGVAGTNICRWANKGNWMRPLDAPRAGDRVPTWRASRHRLRRTLVMRIDSQAVHLIGALEAAGGIDLASLREAIELIKLGDLADRPHTGRHRTPELKSELDEPQARARVIAHLRRHGVDIARAPSAALTDFIECCAAAYNPAEDPMLRERGRYSKRNKAHRRMLQKG